MNREGWISLGLAAVLFASEARAEDASPQFLHALQERGYGDMAVAHLKLLDGKADLPAGLRETWDWEMSRSLRSAAADAFNPAERDALLAESQAHLAKFLKEKPNHPDAPIAAASWGEFLVKRALDLIRAAKELDAKDAEKRSRLLTEARAALSDARDKYRQAEEKLRSRLVELARPSNLPTKKAESPETADARQRLETGYYETQFQAALIDYYLAQTYPDPKNADHVALLKRAAKAFDDVYQRNRSNVIGLYAHMWHGKAMEELGDLQTAQDIYEEVVVTADPAKTAEAGLESLFTQVEHSRLGIVAKQKPKQFLPEALAYLKDYRRWKQTEGYQAIALDAAKAMLAQATKSTGPEKSRHVSDALQLVADGARVRGEHQQEFVLLRRDIIKARGGGEAEAGTFDEAVALGDAAAGAAQWDDALASYARALELAEKTKMNDAAAVATVRAEMDRVELRMAYELFEKGKLDECIEAVGKLVRGPDGEVKRDSETAAQASALAVGAALNLYLAASEGDKAPAIDRLTKVAEFTVKNWPGRPEADDARIALGQAQLAGGNAAGAIDVFEGVNPKSDRFSGAMYLAGQTYLRRYLVEKDKPEEKRDTKVMEADRAKAVDRLTAGLEAAGRRSEPGQPSRHLLEIQLLLAEVRAEGGDARAAAALYQPLVEAIRAEKPDKLDATTLRVFLGAVRAYCSLGDIDKAGDVSKLLVGLGPDTLAINDTLVGFARLLNMERRKADAEVLELETTTKAIELAAAKRRAESIRNLLAATLLKLSTRKQLALAHMVFIGETLNALDRTDEATEVLQRLLKRTESDPAFAEQAKKAMGRIRTELLKGLRKQKRYEEARKQVDQLIKENPNALEPLMEKGQILEAWAEEAPTKFEDAVAHWAMVRNRLQPMRKKPDEYYDVMYNVAKCLMLEAERTTDKAVALDRATKAEQVLKASLILSPKLNGPDTVAKYRALLARAKTTREKSASAKSGKTGDAKGAR